MTTEITDVPARERYEIAVDGELAGFAEYRLLPDRISFTHTLIEDRFGGRGLASALIRHVLDDARGRSLAVLPFCPFVRDFIAKHAEYLDLVPVGQRERFGL